MASRSHLIVFLCTVLGGLAACDEDGGDSDEPLDPSQELAACGLPSPCEDANVGTSPTSASTEATRCILEILSGSDPARLFASTTTISGDVTDYQAIEIHRWMDGSATCVGFNAHGDTAVSDCTIDLPVDCTNIPPEDPIPDACAVWMSWGIESHMQIEPTCK